MRNTNLKTLMFMALCCDLGLLAKKIISPAANVITDSLHIPGGISTSFSLMFLVIAASLTASLTANLIVFRLRGIVLLLYLLISATSGSLCGLLAQRVTARLKCIFLQEGFY